MRIFNRAIEIDVSNRFHQQSGVDNELTTDSAVCISTVRVYRVAIKYLLFQCFFKDVGFFYSFKIWWKIIPGIWNNAITD